MPSPTEATIAEKPPRRVVMLIYPGVTPLDVIGPLEVFDFANRLTKKALYDIHTVAPSTEPVATQLGFSFLPSCAMTDLAGPIDTLLVSGAGGPRVHQAPDELLGWLREAAPRARRFGSICTGAFILGRAGLIDGKRVTTHWARGGELARRNPATRVEIDSIYIRDGKLCTSAGISAGIDLALALVEEDHGRDLALKIARYLVLFLKRSGGQAQFSTVLQSQFSSIPAIEKVQRWCHDNLGADLRVSALAKKAAMSERSFIRAFRESTGRTPAEFVGSIRLEAARRLLEETELATKAIAQRCGLGTGAALRRAFLRELGVPPADYRERFRSQAATEASRMAAQ
jgi:transcriptional regulator GlxA family with amidase domain